MEYKKKMVFLKRRVVGLPESWLHIDDIGGPSQRHVRHDEQ